MDTYSRFDANNIRTLDDLHECDARAMREQRDRLQQEWHTNNAFDILLVNADGTRYFKARRHTGFDGRGSDGGWWTTRFGRVVWRMSRTSNPFEPEYTPEWVLGAAFGQSANGTKIPASVHTKKDAMAIAKAIGMFNI